MIFSCKFCDYFVNQKKIVNKPKKRKVKVKVKVKEKQNVCSFSGI